jgi:ribosome biogenesis GTPase A
MLLINKADYLSEELIVHWNKYFIEKGVKHIFFQCTRRTEKD